MKFFFIIFSALSGFPINTIRTFDYTGPSTVGQAIITVRDSAIRDSGGGTAIYKVTVYEKLSINPPTVTLAPNATATFSATGGVPPYTFSAQYGAIDSLGLYTFPIGY